MWDFLGHGLYLVFQHNPMADGPECRVLGPYKLVRFATNGIWAYGPLGDAPLRVATQAVNSPYWAIDGLDDLLGLLEALGVDQRIDRLVHEGPGEARIVERAPRVRGDDGLETPRGAPFGARRGAEGRETRETVTLQVLAGAETLILDEAMGGHVIGTMPSVGSMLTQRTRFSPRCCSTSAITSMGSPPDWPWSVMRRAV